MRSSSIHSGFTALAAVVLVGAAFASDRAQAAGAQALVTPQGLERLPVLERAKDVGPANANQALTVAVSMPYARPAEVQAFVDAVSNPRSPQYRQFITPEEVGERFGLPATRVEDVAEHLRHYGFTITEVGKNRLAVIANGTVAQAEQAFHTTIRSYTVDPENPYEPSEFIAPSTPVRLPADLASIVIDVHGLDTYTRPRHMVSLLTPALTRALYNTAPIYSTMTGLGRTMGVSNFDGFRANNWLLYISHFGLAVPPGGAGSNISVVPCSGGGSGAGAAGGEGDLDIQMELGMAPTANLRIYDSPPGGNLIAVLSTESSDNQCDAISESYGWQLPAGTANSAHNQHLSMSAQGITYMAASGDSGTSIEPFNYPGCEPEVLSVGGTVANANSVTGQRVSEVNWTGGGGGWSTNTFGFNVRPPWQTGTGVPAINAFNNKRLIPDVAFHSSSGSGAYQFYFNNNLTGGFIGTSFASPIFAGMLQLISLKVISLGGLVPDGNGKRRFGRIQDLIYSQNGNLSIWFDIAAGSSNGNLPSGQGASTPHVGWDTCVGWGPMNCDAFASAVVCDTGGCPGPISSFCYGDGIDPNVTTLCPCFNFGTTGHGCANSQVANGAELTATGDISPDTIVLSASGELPNALSIFLQGDVNSSAGVLFGDGVRCAAGSLKRLFTHNASSGNVSAPSGADPSISVQSANLGAPIPPGAARYYQTYYRDPSLSFCSGLGFNVTNAIKVQW
jgi:subtilase family serine protease